MAIHPNFLDSPYVYIACDTYREPEKAVLRIIRYTYTYYKGRDTLVGPLVILDSIPAEHWGNGCRLLINDDRTMFATIGDAARPVRAQDWGSINGKILRLNLDGSVPSDNPFASDRWPFSLVWSRGHRNPQGIARLSNGLLYASEHGQNHDDEINLIEKGGNYGWPNVTGMCDDTIQGVWDLRESRFCADTGVIQPLITWTPTVGPAGMVYYNSRQIPQWRNSLLMATLGKMKPDLPPDSYSIVQIKLTYDGRRIEMDTAWFSGEFGRIRDLCVSPDGRVFIATSNRDGRAVASLGFPTYEDDRIIEIRSGIARVEQESLLRQAVRPQPVVDHAVVLLGEELGRGRVELYSRYGRRLRSQEFEGGSSFLFVREGLPAGVYMLCFSDAIRSRRVVVVVQ
jgi:glucose/arabinose dehydrogenase